MDSVELVLVMALAVVVASYLVRALPFALPLPLMQILLGALIAEGFDHGVTLDPDIFFLLFLPPLLFLAGWRIPKGGSRRDKAAILELAPCRGLGHRAIRAEWHHVRAARRTAAGDIARRRHLGHSERPSQSLVAGRLCIGDLSRSRDVAFRLGLDLLEFDRHEAAMAAIAAIESLQRDAVQQAAESAFPQGAAPSRPNLRCG